MQCTQIDISGRSRIQLYQLNRYERAAGVAQRQCNGLPRDGPGFDSR